MMKSMLIYACTLTTAVILSQTSQAARLYKWVDDKGNISYQDQPPPDNAKVLDEQNLKQSPNGNNGNSNKQTVLVYIVDNCPQCDDTVSLLQQFGIPFQTVSMVDRDVQQTLLDNTNSLLAPTVQIEDEFITNTKRSNIQNTLSKAGYDLNLDDEDNSESLEYSPETAQ